MYKIITGLTLVLALIGIAVLKLRDLQPSAHPNTVLAEKTEEGKLGGQFAVVVPKDLNNTELQVLNVAYQVAKADGHKNPELLQGIILQETKAGSMKSFKVAGKPGDQYYGISQLKLGAIREVMALYPQLWTEYKFHTHTDDELKANLILNNEFNMKIASKYLILLHSRYGYSGQQLVNAYNRGPGGVQSVPADFGYANEVQRHIDSKR